MESEKLANDSAEVGYWCVYPEAYWIVHCLELLNFKMHAKYIHW